MDRAVKYIKNVAVVLLSGFVLLEAIAAIAAVLSAVTWQAFNDLSMKAIVILGVIFMANLVIALLMGLIPQFEDTNK